MTAVTRRGAVLGGGPPVTALRRGATLAGAALVAAVVVTALLVARGHAAPTPPGVVRVSVGNEVATGWVTARGRVGTVAHVLAAGGPVRAAGHRARVVRTDRRDDVAVLAVPGLRGAAPPRAAARGGEPVTVRVLRDGEARSLHATVRRTITAHLRPLEGHVQVRPALELTAAVEPGDSGAPVLDGDGRVVGVVFARATGSGDVAYAVDAKVLRP